MRGGQRLARDEDCKIRIGQLIGPRSKISRLTAQYLSSILWLANSTGTSLGQKLENFGESVPIPICAGLTRCHIQSYIAYCSISRIFSSFGESICSQNETKVRYEPAPAVP